MKITLLEPQCTGLEHVPFNTALLEAVLLAYPGARVTFCGEEAHVANVRAAAGGFSAGRQIGWKNDFGGIVRGDKLSCLPGIWRSCWRLRQHCRDEEVNLLILCSSSPALLAALELTKPRCTAALVILHSCIAQLRYNPVTQLVRNPLSIHAVARLPVPRGVRVVVLGEQVLGNLRRMGLASSRWAAMDHPFSGYPGEGAPELPGYPPVRFGYLAGFERNSAEVRELLGRVIGATGCGVSWIGRESSSSPALSAGEYRRRLRGVHYAVWIGDPGEYRLRASATFLDAISMGRPLVYIRNDFMDFYRERRGEFGIGVSSIGELEERMISLAGTAPGDDYHRMARTALQAAATFSPRTVAPALKAACEQALGEIA